MNELSFVWVYSIITKRGGIIFWWFWLSSFEVGDFYANVHYKLRGAGFRVQKPRNIRDRCFRGVALYLTNGRSRLLWYFKGEVSSIWIRLVYWPTTNCVIRRFSSDINQDIRYTLSGHTSPACLRFLCRCALSGCKPGCVASRRDLEPELQAPSLTS